MEKWKHGTSTAYDYHKCRCDVCKEWKRVTSAAYYAKNREKIKGQVREYRQANLEHVRERDARYRSERSEELKEQKREYYRQYQKDHPGSVNAKNRRWKAANPWKAWFYNWRRRELARGQVYDEETLEWIKNLNSPPCMYCGGVSETIDHMLPRSRGGTNHRENLTPTCHRCNRRKCAMTVQEFLARLAEEKEA
jgi:hypothetical protein